MLRVPVVLHLIGHMAHSLHRSHTADTRPSGLSVEPEISKENCLERKTLQLAVVPEPEMSSLLVTMVCAATST